MTVSEAAEMWKISKSTVYKYCKNNFVECEKKNNVWVISDNHPKPLNIRKQKITQINILYSKHLIRTNMSAIIHFHILRKSLRQF